MKTEIVELEQPKQTDKNTYRVSPKMWAEWTVEARKLFNFLYGEMRINQSVWVHPQAAPIPAHYWDTICWNAAWEAATALTRSY